MDLLMIDVAGLHTELEATGLPVVGVSGDGRIDYSRALTPEEQATAQQVIAAHDPTKRERDERTARNQAKTYYNGLTAYLDLASPTSAQTVAALKAVIRRVMWLVRNELKS
jgi:hypothetical protein